METEREVKLKLIEAKMAEYEVGSVPYIMYKEILDELRQTSQVKLHVAEEAICESCQ